jgi:hypothetical protein
MLLAGAILALAAPACSRDPQPGTPAAAAEGERLMRRMSDTLAQLSAFRFSTTESLEQVGPSSERRVLRFSRTLTVRRPDAMHFELHGASGTLLDVAGYYEHGILTLRNGIDRVWSQTTVPATLDEMFDDVARRYGLPVPVADVVYSVPYDAFIGRTTKGGFVGRQTIDGVDCVQLTYTDEYVDVGICIPSAGQPLPRRVELVYKLAQGAPKARIDFTNWDVAPRIADGAFRSAGGDAFAQVAFEDLVRGLLPGGHAAREAPAGMATPRAPTTR